MLQALYNAIRKDAEPTEIIIKGRSYATGHVTPITYPAPKVIQVTTLTALVDYLKSNIDELDMSKLLCHVESPGCVGIYSNMLGDFCDRSCYIRAELTQLQIPFNKFLNGEAFNILLQSCFVEYEDELRATDRGLVLAYAANVREVQEGITLDDGVTQAVTVKKGVANVEKVVMPTPVTLRPFRTFTEVEQPASSFVFRAKEGPEFMLVEADGGAWRSEAMKNIKEYMENAVSGLGVIA